MLNFIVNSRSGLGRGQKNIKTIMDYCYAHNVDYTVHITGARGHATEIARTLSQQSPQDTIVAVGGDGTFHEVMNGIIDPKTTPLGFIPSGRGNDYARAAMLPLDPLKALKCILRGEMVYHDYIAVGDKRCLNVAGTGLDVDVLERVAGRNGKISYLLSLVYCLNHFDPYRLKVTACGETKTYECVMVGVCNGVAIGGNIRLSPLSKIDDGKLNVVIMSMPQKESLMKVLPKFKKGKHLNLDITTHFLCEEVVVESENGKPVQLDGEIYPNTLLDCKVVAGGLKTFRID